MLIIIINYVFRVFFFSTRVSSTNDTNHKNKNYDFLIEPETIKREEEDEMKKTTENLLLLNKIFNKQVSEKNGGETSTEITVDNGKNDKKLFIGNYLKLAGCNIYGRMYRVGKIIIELSSPCLECVCADVGVQCNPLPCPLN